MMNKTNFFSHVRQHLFGGSLKQPQVDGMNNIVDAFFAAGLTDLRWLAYMLATVFHETARSMQPIREFGRGKGYDYGKKLKMSRRPYDTPDQIYYGRGYVQLTWFENYAHMGKLLRLDLLNNPDLVLQPDISVKILIEGMTDGVSSFGDFTGRALDDYISGNKCDYVNARKIINGKDKAELIASYAERFERGLKS